MPHECYEDGCTRPRLAVTPKTQRGTLCEMHYGRVNRSKHKDRYNLYNRLTYQSKREVERGYVDA